MSGILVAIGQLLLFGLNLYFWLILIRVLMSWLNPDPYNPVVRMLVRATEPVLAPLRRLLPPFGGLDLSPILALLGVRFIERLVAAVVNPSGSVQAAVAAVGAEFMMALHLVGTFYLLIMLARAGLSFRAWIDFRYKRPSGIDLYHPLVRFIFNSTEPVIRMVRPVVPAISNLDLSPLVVALVLVGALVGLEELARLLVGTTHFGF